MDLTDKTACDYRQPQRNGLHAWRSAAVAGMASNVTSSMEGVHCAESCDRACRVAHPIAWRRWLPCLAGAWINWTRSWTQDPRWAEAGLQMMVLDLCDGGEPNSRERSGSACPSTEAALQSYAVSLDQGSPKDNKQSMSSPPGRQHTSVRPFSTTRFCSDFGMGRGQYNGSARQAQLPGGCWSSWCLGSWGVIQLHCPRLVSLG